MAKPARLRVRGLVVLVALIALGLAGYRAVVQYSERFATGNRHAADAQSCHAAALDTLSESSFWQSQQDQLQGQLASHDEASDRGPFRDRELLRSVDTKRSKRRRRAMELEAQARWHEDLAAKYRALAWRPWASVPPDPPLVFQH